MNRCYDRTFDGVSMSLMRLLFGAVSLLLAISPSLSSAAAPKPTRHVLLVGASIGQDWNLPELPKRVPVDQYAFEAVQVWQFDKSEAVDAALMRPARKFQPTLGYVKGFFKPSLPAVDLFILKECSSYFPSDLPRNRELVQRWVRQIKASGKSLILATTVPVTGERARKNAGKQEGVREFNDWLRIYAKAENIPLMDLEAALRADDQQRYLRDDLTSGDGSHLNAAAYKILDGVLVLTLCERDKSDSACAARMALRGQ